MDSIENHGSGGKIFIISAVLTALLGTLGFVFLRKNRQICDEYDGVDDRIAGRLQDLAKTATDLKVGLQENIEETLSKVQTNVNTTVEKWTQDVKDLLFTKDMQEALDTVQCLLGELTRYGWDMKWESFVIILLALVRKVQEVSDVEHWKDHVAQVQTSIDEKQVIRAQKFGHYA